jgi:hypothetical protein
MTFSLHDSVISSPTNTFATLNVLDKGSEIALNNGNLHPTWSGTSGHSVRTTISFPKTSKWYLEVFSGDNCSMGLIDSSKPVVPSSGALWPGSTGFGVGGSYALAPDGRKVSNSVYSTFLGDFLVGSIIKILFDADSGILQFGIDSGSLTTAYTIDNSKIWLFSIGYWTSGGSNNVVNFGQDSSFAGNKTTGSAYATDGNGIGDFYYSPPTVSGTKALALCTANIQSNLAIDPAVDDLPEDYFVCHKYIGNGNVNGQTITTNIAADLVWIKGTDNNTYHALSDTVRGVSNSLASNTSRAVNRLADDTTEYVGELYEFTNTGFKVKHLSTGVANVNGTNFISWNWKAGGAPSSSDPYMVDNVSKSAANAFSGSYTITPTRASIGIKQGFSIVKYVGNGVNKNSSPPTVPSGLSNIDFAIVKNLDYGSHPNTSNNACNWLVYHKSLSSNNNISLDDPEVPYNITTAGGGGIQVNNGNLQLITNTSSNWNSNVNDSGDNYIGYCFTSVPGFSAFASYEGNAAGPNGPFIHTGFRVAWLMIKNIDSSGPSWDIYDNAREPFNDGSFANLSANSNSTEGSRAIDFLSNGFKIKETNSWNINSSETFIFACFAEMPQKYSVAR